MAVAFDSSGLLRRVWELTTRLWKFMYDGEAVAEGKDYFFHTGVGGDMVVETEYALCLGVVRGVDSSDLAIP